MGGVLVCMGRNEWKNILGGWGWVGMSALFDNACKISFNLSIYFASPVKWSLQGIWSPFPSPKFIILPIIDCNCKLVKFIFWF